MKEEKNTLGTIIINDIFVAVGTVIAAFGLISIFAVGGFGAICSVIGVFRSFSSDSVAVALALSLCGLATAVLMFILGYHVSRVFLDGLSDYIVSRKKKVAALKKG